MFELKTLTGELIDLDKTDTTIELNNSLFNDGSKFTGSLSYPIDVSFTKRNKLLLGYAQAIETGVKATSIEVYAKIGGKSFRKCVLKVGVSDKAFDCNLEIDLGALNNYISNTKLAKIHFPTSHLGTTLPEIETNMMAAAVNLDWRVIPYTFFPVRNTQFTGEANSIPSDYPIWSEDPENPVKVIDPYAKKTDLINSVRVEDGSVKFNVQTAFATEGLYHTTPFFYLPFILDKIASELGMILKGDFIQHPDVAKIVVYNVNDTFITRDNNFGFIPEEQQGVFFSAADHLPDITISEFFKILCAYFCVRITPDIDGGELNISWKKSTFEKPVFLDWSEKLIQIRKQNFEISEGYTLSAEVDKLDIDKVQTTESIVVGAGKDKIDIKAGTLRMQEEPMLDTGYLWNIPIANHPGNIVDPIFRELENYKQVDNLNAFPVRFMVARGMATYGANPIPYPMGSQVGSEISISLSKLNDFAIKPWFSRTYATKTATASFRLTPADICALEDDQIILFKGENGTTVQAIYEKLTFTTKGEQQIAAEMDLMILDSAYIPEPYNNGVYVKLTESNPQTVTVDGPDPSIVIGVASLIKSVITTVDLTISFYSDKLCTIPLTAPDLFLYLKFTKEETRAYAFWQLQQGLTRIENTAFGDVSNKKLHCTNNQVTINGVTKKSYHKYRMQTTLSLNFKWVFIEINRNMSFAAQPDDDYTIVT